jgi:hypothetical protein
MKPKLVVSVSNSRQGDGGEDSSAAGVLGGGRYDGDAVDPGLAVGAQAGTPTPGA